MEHCEIILPISILFLAFMLKLFIDRSAEAPLIVKSLYELPVDIIFLTVSLLAGLTITKKPDNSHELTTLVIFIIVAIINVIIWRRAIKLFEDNYKWWSIVPTVLNYCITIFCLITTINLLIK